MKPLLEFEDDRSAGAAEIERAVAQRETQEVQILKRTDVTDIAADADMNAEEQHEPAADIPPQVVVVRSEHTRRGQGHVCFHQADAGQRIRPDDAQVRYEHE